MSELQHTNIMPVLDYDLAKNNNLWFIMPLAKTNISDISNDLKENIGRVHSIFRQVLVGIAYAHENGVIHRDIKPQNILLFENDIVKIGDFGLGKHLGKYDTSGLTATDEFLGTFVYAAPEQFDHPTNVDNRADIYALGKTLIHMITGSIPPLKDSDLFGITDVKYRRFIERCIQNDPLLRFQSVREMIEDFDAI
jgi:serine/threonine protein kinase